MFSFDETSMMSGQVISKLWLCEILNPILLNQFSHKPDVWVLAGWYGMTNFLLQSRDAHVNKITSFDIDPLATDGARTLNEAFLHLGTFDAQTRDINHLEWWSSPEVVINTSVEHLDQRVWFDRIPSGKLVVLQSNDMKHDDHISNHRSYHDLQDDYRLSKVLFGGYLPFSYPEWSFKRFMTIGIK